MDKLSNQTNEYYKEVDDLINNIRDEYYKQNGDHHKRLSEAMHVVMTTSNHAKKLLAKFTTTEHAGFHYRLDPNWMFVAFTRLNVEELRRYQLTLIEFGIDNHLAYAKIPQSLCLVKPEFCPSDIAHEIHIILRNLNPMNAQAMLIAQEQLRELSESIELDFDQIRCISSSTSVKSKLLKWFSTNTATKIAATWLMTLTTGSPLGYTVFDFHPPYGTIVAVRHKSGMLENREKATLERLLRLIRLLDGHIRALDSYDKIDISADPVVLEKLKPDLDRYISVVLQRPGRAVDINLRLDTVSPFQIISRLGNKHSTKQFCLVVRLAVLSEATFHYLYSDGALILMRIRSFLEGWLQANDGLLRLGGEDFSLEKVAIDVYVSPALRVLAPSRADLYNVHRFDLKENSHFKQWYTDVIGKSTDNKAPVVVYRGSETVGPSIFLAEVASSIAILEEKRKKHKSPIRILNLFSGIGSLELTLLARLRNCKIDASAFSILSLDLQPFPINESKSKELKYMEPKAFQSARDFSHSVPVDIFSLFQEAERQGTGGLLAAYDLIIADPPHSMSIEFLEALTSVLKPNDAGILVLYFSHKEAEWITLFVQMHLDRHKWPRVLNLLIADERIIIALGARNPLSSKDIKDLASRLTQIGVMYKFATKKLPLCLVDANGQQLIKMNDSSTR